VDSRVGGTTSADVDDDLSRCLELMPAIHVDVRHRDISASGYVNSGRQEQTVLRLICQRTCDNSEGEVDVNKSRGKGAENETNTE